MSLESLLASCWLLVIVVIVTVQHFPAIIPNLLVSDTEGTMRIANKKVLLWFLPVPLLALITIIWRYGRRKQTAALPLPVPSTSKASDDVTQELPIASQFIGFVIGRQGNKVKELERQTNTRIRFREAKDGKVAMITGQNEDVERAKEAIVVMIKEKSEKKQVISVEVVIPNFAIGRLIGRQGQNISTMQRESGARITVDNNRGSGTTRICTVSGNSEQVSRGVSLVQQSISESEASQQRNKLNRKLKTDNVNMRSAQVHSKRKTGLKETSCEQSVQLAACTLPAGGEFFPAFVSNVSTSAHVWLQPVSHKAAVLEELCNAMMEAYCNMNVTESKFGSPSTGDYCAAKFSNDGQWYRAQVISTNSTTAHLLFIDYGDDEWHPVDELKILLPQFCSTPIQACKCELGGVAVPEGGWSKEAIELIEDVTMCAKWEPVMVKVVDNKSDPPLVAIVNTSGDQDIDVATKLNAFVNQLPQQLELVNEAVTMEISSTQLESSVNMMFDHLDQDMSELDNKDSNQDDKYEQQESKHDNQEINSTNENDQNSDNQQQQVDEVVVMDTSTQLESSINTFDEAALEQLDDQNNDQDDALGYEVQGVSVTFDSDSDDDHVSIQVEEGGVNESWLHSTSHPTESVSVTITTGEHTSKHVPNYVTVTPVL